MPEAPHLIDRPRCPARWRFVAIAALPLFAQAAPGSADVKVLRDSVLDIAITHGICSGLDATFADSTAPAWAAFSKRYASILRSGRQRADGVIRLALAMPAQTPEEADEQRANCDDLQQHGGFDPAREPDPRLATPDGCLALLEHAVMANDRDTLLLGVMGPARQRLSRSLELGEDGRLGAVKLIRAARVALAQAPPDDAEQRGIVRGHASQPTLMMEKIRHEWRLAHL